MQIAQCNVPAIGASVSRNGKLLLVNYQDNAVRAFELCITDASGSLRSYSLPEVEKAAEKKAKVIFSVSLYPIR